MTKALCFQCGEIKFGALVPCFACGAAAVAIDLNIAFSDHHIVHDSLVDLGNVIKAINEADETQDQSLRLWTFLRYVTVNHPEILTIEMDESSRQTCETLLSSANIPSIEVTHCDRS